MTDSPLSRFAAPIVIVGGAMVVITRMVSLAIPTELEALKAYVLTATFAVNSVASIVAFALLALALVAAYDREARPSSTPGFVAFGAAIFGTVFMAGDWWFEAFAVPRIAEIAPQAFETFVGGRLQLGGLLSFALFGLGWALFGIASLRARVFPAAISVAILAGGLLSGVPIGKTYLIGGVILGLALVWLGGWMVRTPVAATARGEKVESR
jgi:hypothetical protein